MILDPKTKQVWWIAGAAEIKNRAKVLIHELSGPGLLLNSRFHDYNQQHFQTIRQKNYRNDLIIILFYSIIV